MICAIVLGAFVAAIAILSVVGPDKPACPHCGGRMYSNHLTYHPFCTRCHYVDRP